MTLPCAVPVNLFGAENDAVDPRDECLRLRARIEKLEAERDLYATQNAELFVLQQVFSTINSILDVDDILSMVLRGVAEAVKFRRVILFDVVNGVISRRMECNALGSVTHCSEPRDYRAGSTLYDVADGDLQLASGSATDADRPLDDTRGWYGVVPLVARNVVRGLLYADEPADGEVSDHRLRVLLDFAAQAAVAVENARLYDETRRLLEETQRLALTDALTGIPNRRAFDEMLEREIHACERYDRPLALAIFDLDNLKQVNDSGGHGMGDLVLQRFASVLKGNARKVDIVARYAGDEFVLVMTQSNRDRTVRAVERMQASLRRNGLAASVGIAMFPDHGSDAHSLFLAADEALYRAKQTGKDRAAMAQPAPERTVPERQVLPPSTTEFPSQK